MGYSFNIEISMANERIPPHSIDAEMSVLGALMLSTDAIHRIADSLRPADFYKPAHSGIYEAMLDLYTRAEPIDVLSVTARLEEKGNLAAVGGAAYLATLVNSVPTASHIAHYGALVRKKKILRDLINASYHIGEMGFDEDTEIDKLLDNAEQKIFQISQNSVKQNFLHVKDMLTDAWTRFDELSHGKRPLRGVSTGFTDLDYYLSGLQKSDLIVLAARPTYGKTSLAMNIARNVALTENVPVGVFSLEMSKEQLIDRILVSEAHVNSWNLAHGKTDGDGDFVRIRDAMERLSQAPLFIDDSGSSNIMQIRTMARRLKAEQKDLGLLVIDYLQLIRGDGRPENRVQEVSEISRALKGLAKELNVPILALSQLSRAVEARADGVPKLSDLRESGSIEQDADVVLFIHREEKYRPDTERKNVADIIIAKHRNGPVGKAELFFDEQCRTSVG